MRAMRRTQFQMRYPKRLIRRCAPSGFRACRALSFLPWPLLVVHPRRHGARARACAEDDPVKISDRALDALSTAMSRSAKSVPRSPPAIPISRKALSSSPPIATCRSIRHLADKVKRDGAVTLHWPIRRRALCPRPVDRRADRSREPRRHCFRRSLRLRRYPRRRARGHALSDRPALRSWILGLAGVGIAITAATYATAGVDRAGAGRSFAGQGRAPHRPAEPGSGGARGARGGESRGGRWPGRACRKMSAASKPRPAPRRRSTALRSPKSRKTCRGLARLAAAKGGKTRAIVKLLGRAAIVLTAGAFDLAIWLFWAAFALFGFCSACKAAVERMTQRYLDGASCAASRG